MINTLRTNACIALAIVLSAVFFLNTLVVLPANAQDFGIKSSCKTSYKITNFRSGNFTINENLKISEGLPNTPITANVTADTATSDWGIICLINTANTIANWAFYIVTTISFILILFAGFVWISSGSNPENAGRAGKIIAAALIGMVIAFSAKIIPSVITGILT